MAAFETEGARWRTSSYSGTGGGQCVEVADLNRRIMVRDSKTPGGTVLGFPPEAWAAFLGAAARDKL
ncbi:DUF397 domain-containing protein [Marinactinospora thermotolerans]|uniref:DUF397 domain-containing protein n=1 Tax=Marinactinospora thermotolerans DSM 45154 TaxID=1122192 RepID=A0A1T4SEC2_9ACTN|nr:DUF397 domain-containing protein [Marinactinospora thermotolerans]SKA26248.1 protein of unknown function [Marinactinospora thermotolerans DSM 45154]